MSPATAQVIAATDETAEAADIVERFLVASMVPDPADRRALYRRRSCHHLHGRPQVMAHPRETAAFNAGRYKWVKKNMERTDVVPVTARPSSTTSARSTANGRMARRSKATVMSIALSCAAARSCRWMSGTTAPNAS